MTEQITGLKIESSPIEGAIEPITSKWPLAHLIQAVYYEYPDLPMPHSGEFHGLIQVASTHTYNQHNGRYRGGSGIVIGYWWKDLWKWIEENSPIDVDYASIRKALDLCESPCGICAGTERPPPLVFPVGEELQLEDKNVDEKENEGKLS